MNIRSIAAELVAVRRESTGERITRLRLEWGWSIRELAQRAGLHPTTVQRAEDDARVFADTIEALADALSVDVAYLWNGRGEP